MNVTLNLLFSKKRTSLYRSNSAIFNCWISWIFLEAQQVLILFWGNTKVQRQKDSSPTNGLITPTKCSIQNFPSMLLPTVNFTAATSLKPNTRTMLNFWKVDWPQNKPLSNQNCQGHPLLELKNINTRIKYSSFKEFLRRYNKDDVLPTLEAMQKNDCLSPRQRYRYVEAWLYFTKLG